MALSFVIKETKNTSDHTYSIPFSVLDNSHIKLLVTPVAGGAQVAHTNFTLNTAGTVMTIAGSYDVPLKIYRETPGTTDATKNTKFVDFVNGATITETDLDNSTLQAIYAAQESIDHVNTTVTESTGSGDMPSPTNTNYMLASSPVDGALGATWLSGANGDSLIGITEANTAAMIPRRNSAGTPAITTDLVGNVTGNATGSAGSLAPGGTIGVTGDVTYTSPTFTGSNVTAASVVNKINGVTVTAAVAGDDGEVLTYNHGSTRWEPATLNPVKAVVSVKGTALGDGQSIAAGDWRHVYLPTAGDTLMNQGTGITVVNGATDGYVTLIAGTWQVTWSQVFGIDMEACSTRLRQASDTGFSADLATSGVGTIVRTGPNGNSSATSTGFARITIAGGTTRHIRLEAISDAAGELGENIDGTSISDGYLFTLITITKEF